MGCTASLALKPLATASTPETQSSPLAYLVDTGAGNEAGPMIQLSWR